MSSSDTPKPVSTFNPGPYWTAFRYFITGAGSFVTGLAGAHVITGDTATELTNSLTALSSGITTVAGALGTIAGVAMAAYGAWTATRKARREALDSDPKVKAVVVDTATTANASGSSPKIIPAAAAAASIIMKGSIQ